MILSTCFYIDNTRWFKEQFELSRCLFNQARYFFRDYYDKNKVVMRENDLEKVLRTQDTKLNYCSEVFVREDVLDVQDLKLTFDGISKVTVEYRCNSIKSPRFHFILSRVVLYELRAIRVLWTLRIRSALMPNWN